MATAITKAPNAGPASASWTRSGNSIQINWTYTSTAKSDTNPARVTGIEILEAQWNKDGKLIFDKDEKNLGTITSRKWDLSKGSVKTRAIIYFRNAKGLKVVGPYVLTLTAPPAPTLGSFSYDTSDKKELKITVSAQKAILARPRRTIQIQVFKSGKNDGKTEATTCVYNKTQIGWDSNTSSYSYTWSTTNAETWLLNKESDYVCYTIKATALGVEGTNLNSSTVSKSFYIGTPAKPSITELNYYSSGVNVAFKDNWTTTRPVDAEYKLQIGYATKFANVEWTDVGDAYTRPLTQIFLDNADITPETGEYTWVRVKATGHTRTVYSDAKQLSQKLYFTPASTSKDAPIKTVQVTSATAGDDNTSIHAIIGYASDNYTATEISYSTDKEAWKSTKDPDSFTMEDGYWQDSKSQSTTHPCSTSVKISDLDENTTYYIRARRYKVSDTTERTDWSQIATCNTSYNDTDGVVLTGSDIVATGKDATFTWTFNEDLKQETWSIMENGAGLVSGTGSITSCNYAFNTAGDHKVYAICSFDKGKSYTSDPITVSVIDAPVLSFSTAPAETVTALPCEFEVTADKADADIQVKILAHGVTRYTPEGKEEQYRNDVVDSKQDTGTVTCSFDDGDKLWDGAWYQIQAIASLNGVKSEILKQNFYVKYTDTVTAPEPENVTITPTSDKGAVISVSTLADGTQWDLYRGTDDERNFLIAQNLTASSVVTDNYAPYKSKGSNRYIIQVRNGQEQFDYRDYDYTLTSGVLRFDWDGKFVELPYNIEIEDETDKQFEQQIYLDGTQKGAWGASVIRQASLSTDTIYITDEDTQRKVRDLARYQGAVFVRTPLGQAYTANVEVNKISKSYDSKVMAVSFDCTEIDLTSDFEATSTEA
jgi:hypothetical protein